MLCQMTEPFLPLYDFEELENEPDPIPEPEFFAVAVETSFADMLIDALRRQDKSGIIIRLGDAPLLKGELGSYEGVRFIRPPVFNPVNYGCIAIGVRDYTK